MNVNIDERQYQSFCNMYISLVTRGEELPPSEQGQYALGCLYAALLTEGKEDAFLFNTTLEGRENYRNWATDNLNVSFRHWGQVDTHSNRAFAWGPTAEGHDEWQRFDRLVRKFHRGEHTFLVIKSKQTKDIPYKEGVNEC